MTNYTFASVTTAVVGIASTETIYSNIVGIALSFTTTNGTIPMGNITGMNITDSRPGSLTGRRPSVGQLFPRGVYNK
jgi:hypothetical protein